MVLNVEQPITPDTVQETGLDVGLLEDLVLKTLYFSGNVTAGEIAEKVALSPGVAIQLLQFLRRERLCEVTGGNGQFATNLHHTLTEAGFARAAAALAQSGYVGPAPVPLKEYVDRVRMQSLRNIEILREVVEKSLDRLVLRPQTRDQIGQAFTAKRATLLYGPSGNGKSTAAECLRDALPGNILIPYAVEVMHQVVQVYDPASHERVEDGDTSVFRDRRWITIKRPAVFAAGELAANQLELMLDDASKTYEAPIQMKANGGLLVIDDFGRQRLDAAYLLNRWIVPLEKGIDTLSLHNGIRFDVPFDVIPLFLTNRPPSELADEAFLRRIRYKVLMPGPTIEMFGEILEKECRKNGIDCDRSSAEFLVREYFLERGREMRGCHPRDIIEAIVDAARYDGRQAVMNSDTLQEACSGYFVS